MKAIGLLAGVAVLAACGQGDAAEAPAKAPASIDGSQVRSPVVPAGVAPEVRVFREWRAVCDNGNRCVAYSGTNAPSWIRVASDAGPSTDAPCIGFGEGFRHDDPSAEPTVLVADGRPVLRTQGTDGRYCADSLVGPVATALSVASDARVLALTSGGRSATVPASGMKAAMLWIDERQGRVDTTKALIRHGDRPGTAVPPTPDLPVVVAAPTVTQTGFENAQHPQQEDPSRVLKIPATVQALPAVRPCLENTADRPYLRSAVLAARLGRDVELWGVPCDSGAYNASYLMFVTGPDGSDPQPAVLRDPDPRNAAAASTGWGDDVLVNPIYDPATSTLRHFPRGRGLGDCGVIQSWTWTGRGFAPRETRVMGECWGMPSEIWPTTWRTR